MNITKQIASEVAILLLQKQANEIKSLNKDLETEFTEMVFKKIPVEVLDVFGKFSDYFGTRKSFQLSGNGFNYKWLSASRCLPAKNASFCPDEKEAKRLLSIINKIDDKSNKYQDLLKEIEVTLFSLRTYKRVEENFPEAFVLLPKKQTVSLALNLSDLRNKLK